MGASSSKNQKEKDKKINDIKENNSSKKINLMVNMLVKLKMVKKKVKELFII